MTINSFEILLYLLTLLLPGYIIRSMIGFLIPSRQQELKHLTVFRLLMYGGVNLVIAIVIFGKRITGALEEFQGRPTGFAESATYLLEPGVFWIWVGVVFGLPFVLSLGWAVVLNLDVHRRLAHYCGFRPELDDPSAWDYRLSRVDRPSYVIVTLTDDTPIFGIFGSDSYASSVAEERDIYLQQVLAEGFKEVTPVSGMWISAADIKRVEIFWPEEEETAVRYTWRGCFGRLKAWIVSKRGRAKTSEGRVEARAGETPNDKNEGDVDGE